MCSTGKICIAVQDACRRSGLVAINQRGLPVVIAVAESSHGDLKGLPHRVQRVLHHLGLVADGKPGEKGRQMEGGKHDPETQSEMKLPKSKSVKRVGWDSDRRNVGFSINQ